MAKKDWQIAEAEFEGSFARMGKRAFVHRFADAAELRGRTGAVGKVRPQPSDYLVVMDGDTAFCEVKSTVNSTSFPFAMLRITQSAVAKMVLAAGGKYIIFLKNVTTGQWYQIGYSVIHQYKSMGKASIPWSLLEEYKIDLS